ncbi:hypothetical protein [Nesterenkonia pannonica]|uniref:hypothetical protein n=1 Tax=Nesterenkonia pannonica TaxID=1548602 RepID=UPI00216496C8|nr:hypothetical protein [Nesterenkonia pannonica]
MAERATPSNESTGSPPRRGRRDPRLSSSHAAGGPGSTAYQLRRRGRRRPCDASAALGVIAGRPTLGVPQPVVARFEVSGGDHQFAQYADGILGALSSSEGLPSSSKAATAKRTPFTGRPTQTPTWPVDIASCTSSRVMSA